MLVAFLSFKLIFRIVIATSSDCTSHSDNTCLIDCAESYDCAATILNCGDYGICNITCSGDLSCSSTNIYCPKSYIDNNLRLSNKKRNLKVDLICLNILKRCLIYI